MKPYERKRRLRSRDVTSEKFVESSRRYAGIYGVSWTPTAAGRGFKFCESNLSGLGTFSLILSISDVRFYRRIELNSSQDKNIIPREDRLSCNKSQ